MKFDVAFLGCAGPVRKPQLTPLRLKLPKTERRDEPRQARNYRYRRPAELILVFTMRCRYVKSLG